ncbi:MAG: bifunctional UDP-N-acetylglucosamine diphosphorylase/glucosamine-1-phosphate N-acetyltransferase GlmU [Chloroflexi bacterium]|nr:bifunctional UDP-N-acetylglucosamine diphosphorylase/glucosamine-1-phosphate N-acetyltransferase GlmU [Chloroflexota bacterium]
MRTGVGDNLRTDSDEPPQAQTSSTRHRWVAVIMAAGQGTRMRSSLPKVAHPLAGKPVVRHVIDAAREAGVDDCIVIVGADEAAAAVRAAAGEGVRFAVQAQPLGTGDAVASAREAAGEADHVLIMNGDVPLVLPATLCRLMDAVTRPAGPDVALLTAHVPVEAYGFLELTHDRVTAIIETKEAEAIDRSEPRHINSGQYAVRAAWLWAHLPHITPAPNGERFLTQLAAMAHEQGNPAVAVFAEDPAEVRGINDRIQLAEAEAAVRDRIRCSHMLGGVTIIDPPSTFIDAAVCIGPDTTIGPNTYLEGDTSIGSDCMIGPGSSIRDSRIGDGCTVRFSMIEQSTLESSVDVGPYSHLRPRSYLCHGVHIGNYAEVKASRLGRNTKMGHFSYIGDAEVGDDVNIGAGTITANYDGVNKHRTTIGDGAFIGSDTMLVAPVSIGRGARTSAGSVVNRDVPDGMMAIGAPARIRAQGAADGKEDSDPGR